MAQKCVWQKEKKEEKKLKFKRKVEGKGERKERETEKEKKWEAKLWRNHKHPKTNMEQVMKILLSAY